MRTNIDIDDHVLQAAMRSGAYKTKKEVVEAGLRLIARQAAYREILKWEGKLKWDDHEGVDPAPDHPLQTGRGTQVLGAPVPAAPQAQESTRRRRSAGR